MRSEGEASGQSLMVLFAAEAQRHLATIAAALDAFADPGETPRADASRTVLDTLHTFKGAARAVGLSELELLCHALDGVFRAAAGHAALTPGQLFLICGALELAGLLLEKPAGRVRNQALAMIGQLDDLAHTLAAPDAAAHFPNREHDFR